LRVTPLSIMEEEESTRWFMLFSVFGFDYEEWRVVALVIVLWYDDIHMLHVLRMSPNLVAMTPSWKNVFLKPVSSSEVISLVPFPRNGRVAGFQKCLVKSNTYIIQHKVINNSFLLLAFPWPHR
jgi:hypothetical protein